MLTPMHVQYLIGLFCLRRNPEAVDITVGDMLHDPAASIDRDVDVTVTYKDDAGASEAIAGYEVKREAEPLDVTRIEQLCIKLNDIPALKRRAVVSASGYSAAAAKKAAAHQIELYEFAPWQLPVQSQFEKMTLIGTPADSFLFTEQQLLWLDGVGVRFNSSTDDHHRLKEAAATNPQALSADGNQHPEFTDLDQVVRKTLANAAFQISQSPAAQAILMAPRTTPPNEQPDGPYGPPLSVPDVIVPLAAPVFIRVEGHGCIRIQDILFSGQLQWNVRRAKQRFTLCVVMEHLTFMREQLSAKCLDKNVSSSWQPSRPRHPT